MPYFILTTHQKGGVGKSTLTYNLAVNLKDKAKVCIVDIDVQGSLSDFKDFSPVPILSPDKLPELQNSDFDFVFIDTPPYLSNKLPELCSLANVILIPTKAGVFDVLAIKSTIEIVKQSKGEKKALIVFNMVKPNTSLTEEIKSQVNEYNITIAQTMVSDLVAFSRSALHNGVEDNKKALSQIEALTNEILKILAI
ncbi:plasmid segregation oscillating ATPase ParF [Chryseobacterium joostei]|uniref:Plasmid segregation oscillating ATPase ParF n=1 Tax=Chryseobacterium joostei TaxID=112234 RepID=A0A1N7KMX8_9FLAO|nr:ParA family protein [Chryseobacterium joostei]SIS62972.1 plasmid segregation oscillating ATPase ParF [Chryseobacterium joostei]